jgi:hypothetical protein
MLGLLLYVLSYSQTQSNVSTPKGSAVTAFITSEMSPTERQYWDNYWRTSSRTYIQYFSDGYSSSNRFNCHGYAWNMTEGGPVRWIGFYVTTDEDVYMSDGSYIKVCNEIYPGKVSWVGGDHSAVTTTTPGRWISKWNKYPLIEHNKDDTPFGTNYAYYASTKVSGNTSSLCTGTRTFSVINIPGATYIWTYSTTVTPVGTTNTPNLTVQRNGTSNGAAWVQVQITTPCSGTPATSRIDFRVGIYTSSDYPITGPSTATCGTIVTYSAPQLTGATNYVWTYQGSPWSYLGGQGTRTLTMRTPNTSSGGSFHVRVDNACGAATSSSSKITVVTCILALTDTYEISPNPATNSITVSTSQNKSATSTNTSFDEIRVFDFQGNLKKYQQYNKVNQATINISDLTNGTYLIEITNGTYKEKQQLIIQK